MFWSHFFASPGRGGLPTSVRRHRFYKDPGGLEIRCDRHTFLTRSLKERNLPKYFEWHHISYKTNILKKQADTFVEDNLCGNNSIASHMQTMFH